LVLQQITTDNLPHEIKSLIGEEVGNIAKLAIVILTEKKLGQVTSFVCSDNDFHLNFRSF